jgi:hypothetical protein
MTSTAYFLKYNTENRRIDWNQVENVDAIIVYVDQKVIFVFVLLSSIFIHLYKSRRLPNESGNHTM